MVQKFNNYIPENTTVEISPYPVLARVISHLDPTFMGRLQVEILREVGNDLVYSQTQMVRMVTPFWGQTQHTENTGYNDTQKSYGMWMVPPDVGTLGLVIFINGNPKRGFWLGFIPDEHVNFMVPGLAATEYTETSEVNLDNGQQARLPVAEYNKKFYKNQTSANINSTLKPVHPLADVLTTQGLVSDDIRGITTSSARRDTPSMVFGISTPGPLDRKSSAPKIDIGPTDDRIQQFMSRVGGTTFVMDDGDSAFLRKGPASTTSPEYAAIEQGDSVPTDPNIPHNELVRIRTRTGHQILLHNSEDLIYIGNAKGTAWIELTSNGKIDIFSADSISIHTNIDLNLRAGRDINLEAGRNFNLHTVGNKSEIIQGEVDTIVYKDNKITTAGNLNLATTGSNRFTSNGRTDISAGQLVATAGRIYWNSKTKAIAATEATPLTLHKVPINSANNTISTIMKRVPMHEPWPHHENLDPSMFTVDKTDREVAANIAIPDAFKKYTTSVDTFRRDPV